MLVEEVGMRAEVLRDVLRLDAHCLPRVLQLSIQISISP
jgi:hypothetical protein